MGFRLVLLNLAFLVAITGAAQAQAQKPGSGATAPAQSTAGSDYIIGPEDILVIHVWKEPDLSTKVTVRPDGKVTMVLIGELQASGLTTKQLEAKIVERLGEFVSSPHVTVSVDTIKSQSVFIMGEVAKPGPYPLGSPTTVLELLARAGSFTDIAKPKKIKIIRKEGTKTVQFNFNYQEIVDGKNLEQNITLKSGDVVIVP